MEDGSFSVLLTLSLEKESISCPRSCFSELAPEVPLAAETLLLRLPPAV